jgi:hypothetical protein
MQPAARGARAQLHCLRALRPPSTPLPPKKPTATSSPEGAAQADVALRHSRQGSHLGGEGGGEGGGRSGGGGGDGGRGRGRGVPDATPWLPCRAADAKAAPPATPPHPVLAATEQSDAKELRQ